MPPDAFNLWVTVDFPVQENFSVLFSEVLRISLVSSVPFKDETHFSRDNMNIHNQHQWAEIPQCVINSRCQQQFSINVLAEPVTVWYAHRFAT
jgi:hypothetical protein